MKNDGKQESAGCILGRAQTADDGLSIQLSVARVNQLVQTGNFSSSGALVNGTFFGRLGDSGLRLVQFGCGFLSCVALMMQKMNAVSY